MKKHIVILGKLNTKYNFMDFDDENLEVWSMNTHTDEMMLPRVDKWFDLHENPTRQNADYTKENFPFEKCHEIVGRRFCSTMAYMIMYAIINNVEKISLYGSKFIDDGNLRRQRELHNVREVLWFALARGIELNICAEDLPYLFPEHIPDDGMDFDQ